MRSAKKVTKVLSVVMSLLMIISIISFPTLKASAAGGVDGFVERCYTVTLDRGSDPSGFADWKDQLLNGKSVGVNIAYGFLFSAEYKNKNKSNEDYVKDLYKLFMDREPDQAGFDDWTGKLENGASKEEVFAGFANSQEFYNICESYGITAGYFAVGYDRKQVNNVNLFVERLYQTCLGRRGDRGGQKDWVNKLLKKEITGIECARCFIQSKEYVNKGLSDEDYVENMYKAMMGRDSDSEGKANWLKALSDGKTRDEVFAGFANSKEFGDICAAYKIDKGSYTAKDVSKPKEEQQQQQQPSGKKFRAVRKDYNCGDYTLLEYKDKTAYPSKETRYDKDGNYKGLEYIDEQVEPLIRQHGGITYKEDGTVSDSSFVRTSCSEDGTQETVVYYSSLDDIRSVKCYYVYEKETFKGNLRVKKYTEYNSNGDVNSMVTYEYDSNGKTVSEKRYYSDGTLTWETKYEYYNQSDDEYKDRKTIYDIQYSSTGEITRKEVNEYDGNGNNTKTSTYEYGELYMYVIRDYDGSGNLLKQTAYHPDGKKDYQYVYEYDSNGNRIKETDYHPNGSVIGTEVITYDSKGNIVSQIFYDGDNAEIRSRNIYEYNDKDQLVKYTHTANENKSDPGKTVITYDYDQDGNQIKETRSENGQEVYWVKTQYEEY